MTDECISPLRRRMIEDMTVRNFVPICRGCQGRGRCSKRLYDGSSHRAAEEDRAVSQVRANGSDPSSHRRRGRWRCR
jgi:hypothetical protein